MGFGPVSFWDAFRFGHSDSGRVQRVQALDAPFSRLLRPPQLPAMGLRPANTPNDINVITEPIAMTLIRKISTLTGMFIRDSLYQFFGNWMCLLRASFAANAQ